jgi:hypothetical protein
MKRLATPFLLLLLCIGLPAAASAQSLLFDYVGFDYENPDPNPGTFGEAGTGYVSLGFVPNLFGPYLVFDTTLNEYTYVMSGLTLNNINAFGNIVILDYSPGTLSIYEDLKSTGTPGDYGTNPPGPQAPPTFVDGTLFLTGTLTGFQIVLDVVNETGSFNADYAITGGSQFVNFPLNQLTGWTFAGATGNALNIPSGYYHQIDGQTFLNKPLLARRVSWAGLKQSYR